MEVNEADMPLSVARSLSPELSARPVVAAIATVFYQGRVLLVRRANPPDVGRWGFPGGKIDSGETIENAAVRELFEETGVRASARQVFTALDVFDRDARGALRAHFVLIAVLCQWEAGEPVAGDDALEARWFRLNELEDAGLALSQDVADLAQQAAALSQTPYHDMSRTSD